MTRLTPAIRDLHHDTSLAALKNIAAQLRIDSVRSTSEAGSGHPTTCLSAADIVSTLFFDEMRFDPKNPRNPDNDRFVLSKGHAAPILYAAWAEAGSVPARGAAEAAHDRVGPRRTSDAALVVRRRGDRIARPGYLRRDRHGVERAPHRLRVPHLRALGDGEMAGRVGVGSRRCRAPLQARQPVRASSTSMRLGQSQPRSSATTWTNRRALECVRLARHRRRRPRHPGAPEAPARSARDKGRPTMVLARTLKGKGLAAIEGKDGWHGKALKKGDETDKAIAELEKQMCRRHREAGDPGAAFEEPLPRAQPITRRFRRRLTRRVTRSLRAKRGASALAAVGEGRSAHRRARRRRQELDVQRQVREGRRPTASTRTSSPSRSWSARPWGWRRGARFRSPRLSPAS